MIANPRARTFFRIAMIVACFVPCLGAAQEHPPEVLPLAMNGMNEVIVIDRLIADRAYANIKAGRPADQGIDFTLLDRTMERYRPELERFDPVYYAALRRTYERMKEYVTNPQSDFIRAIKEPGSVEFPGRSPLPAAAFSDPTFQATAAAQSAQMKSGARPRPSRTAVVARRGPGRGIGELEPYLSGRAKEALAKLRGMPEETYDERTAKREAAERAIAAWERDGNRLEAEVMLELLRAMQADLRPLGALLGIDADVLPEGMTREMFDRTYRPPRPGLREPAAGEQRVTGGDRPSQ